LTDKPAEVAHLPDHYRDPFDRALVAQAWFEPLHLITHRVFEHIEEYREQQV
jgi:PIN domain nuclease of toxin-antitoxin system